MEEESILNRKIIDVQAVWKRQGQFLSYPLVFMPGRRAGRAAVDRGDVGA